MLSAMPFVKITTILILGIVLSTFFNVDFTLLGIAVSFLLLLFIHLFVHKYYRLSWIFGLSILVFFGLVGIARTSQLKQEARTKSDNGSEFVVVRVVEQPKVTAYHVRTRVEIVSIKSNQGWQKGEGQSLLMLEKDSTSQIVKTGDLLAFEPNFEEVESNGNPEAFNYKRYLFFHLVSQQAHLKSKQWTLINEPKTWFQAHNLDLIRQNLIDRFRQYGITGDELSVLSALILGYSNDIAAEVQQAYASTGAVHILAVSGLHVAILYLILSRLLFWMGKDKYSKVTKLIVVLSAIWFYSLLSGGSPSVLRSAVMFSLIAIGQILHQKGNIYNVVFASAFILLIYDPFLLYNLGFQLSYLAVISIIFFQPLISAWWVPRYKVLQWIWDLTNVGIAAQILTVPLTVYYFHQFPNYFMVVNLLAVPLSTVLMWVAMLFYMALPIPIIAHYIAMVLKWLTFAQNYIVKMVGSWPYALTTDLYIDLIQLFLIFSTLLIFMWFLAKPKASKVLILVSGILILVVYSDWIWYQKQSQKKMIVYNIKGHTALNFVDGKTHILVSSLARDSKASDFHLKNHWLSLGLEQEKHLSTKQLQSKFALSSIIKSNHPNFFVKGPMIQFYNKRILVIQYPNLLERYKPKKLKLDYIILSKNVRIDPAQLDLYFEYQTLIIDGSHSEHNRKYYRMLKSLSPSKHIHLVADQGAFIIDV